MNFIVTGSSSGIGSSLKRRYEQFPEQFGGELVFNPNEWRLGDKFYPPYNDFGLIHLAHSREFSFEQNVGATEKLYRHIKPGSIYLSTVSAHSNSRSNYGKSKYSIEQIFLGHGAAVIKSGLICSADPTAMLKTLYTIVNRLPIIPLPFRGENLFYLTDQEHLVTLIAQLTHDSDNTIYRAFSTKGITLKQLLKDLAANKGLTRLFVDLPSPLSWVMIALLSKVLGRFSFSDSLNSLINAPDLRELGDFAEYEVNFPDNPHLIKYN
jgi:hypothetical protein